jgi:hypothetical protein
VAPADLEAARVLVAVHVITLMVNVHDEDPAPAITSARTWIPAIDELVVQHGRYAGFPGPRIGPEFESEHVKRNRMLERAREHASPDRFLLWLDCDERVTYASPQLAGELARCEGDVVGLRFIHPLAPDKFAAAFTPGLGMPGRSFRDHVTPCFPGRIFRHLPGLEFRHRHDYLVDRDSGRALMGWSEEVVERPSEVVDLDVAHFWWTQPAARREAKERYYAGPTRQAESRLRVGRNV